MLFILIMINFILSESSTELFKAILWTVFFWRLEALICCSYLEAVTLILSLSIAPYEVLSGVLSRRT